MSVQGKRHVGGLGSHNLDIGLTGLFWSVCLLDCLLCTSHVSLYLWSLARLYVLSCQVMSGFAPFSHWIWSNSNDSHESPYIKWRSGLSCTFSHLTEHQTSMVISYQWTTTQWRDPGRLKVIIQIWLSNRKIGYEVWSKCEEQSQSVYVCRAEILAGRIDCVLSLSQGWAGWGLGAEQQ